VILARLRRPVSPTWLFLLCHTWVSLVHGVQTGDGSRRSPGGFGTLPTASSSADPSSSAGLFITGTVTLEDGAPAPKSTRVECVCSSRTRRSVAVDSRGFFSLQIGGSASYITSTPDADESPIGSTDAPTDRTPSRLGLPIFVDWMSSERLKECEVRATLDGFRSNTVSLEGSTNLGQLDLGTIVLYPLTKVSGTLVSVTGLRAPKEARKALERAAKSLQERNYEKAQTELNKAVLAYPEYAEAWFALGQLHERARQIQDARSAYQRALASDSNYVKPYIALARLAGSEQHWKEVSEITDLAIALDPVDFPEAYYLNSLAYYRLSSLDAAERSARKVLRLDPLHRMPATHLILAEILEQKQDFAGCIEQLRSYLQILPGATSADRVRARIKKLEESLRKGQ